MRKPKSTSKKKSTKIEPSASAGLYDASLGYRKFRTSVISTRYNDDYYQNVTNSNWQLLLSQAREIFSNVGAVKNAIHEIADLSIGDAWNAKYKGTDEEWGKIAEKWLNEWFKICDVKGQPNTLLRDLKLASISVDRDGDCLVVLTKSQDGKFPRIQWIPAHMLGNRDGEAGSEIKSGIFKGYKNYNGVIVNEYGSAVGYYILQDKPENDLQISVVDSQLVYDPEYIDQYRGMTSLASALNDWEDYKTIKSFEVKAIKQASNMALAMHVPAEQINDVAGDEPDSPFVNRTTVSGPDGKEATINEKTLQGGEVLVFAADAGAKLEVLENNRPGQNTAAFLMDHVLKHAFLSMRLPIEFSYDLNSRGAVTKLLAQKIQRRIEDRQQQVLYPLWKRIVTYALGVAIKNKLLPPSNDWWNFEPTYPRSFSVENFKDTKSDLDMYSKGILTGTQIAAGQGYDYYENVTQKCKELAYAKQQAQQYGVSFSDVVQLTPNGNPTSSAPQQDLQQTTDNQV